MKRITIFVVANLLLPLHGQSLSGSKPPPKKINANEAMSLIGGGATPDTTSIGLTDNKKKPKPSKEVEKLFNELINTEAEKNKGIMDAQALNKMLTQGQKDNLSLLLVKNNSECNMVMRIEGKVNYQLPIAAGGQNSVLLPKGLYLLRGNVCELNYEAEKDLNKNVLVSLKRVED